MALYAAILGRRVPIRVVASSSLMWPWLRSSRTRELSKLWYPQAARLVLILRLRFLVGPLDTWGWSNRGRNSVRPACGVPARTRSQLPGRSSLG